jgi:predicted nucleic acid-binding protein
LPYLIDTNIAVHLRDRDPVVRTKMGSLDDLVLLSVISRVELEGGVYSDPSKLAARRARLDAMLLGLAIVPFTDAAAVIYGQIVATAGFSRRKILDRMIGAQSLLVQATLVTMNPSDFRDIAGLRVLAW